MKILIAEDDFSCRFLLQKLLEPYGTSHTVINGREAVQAFHSALESNEPYDLICLDIMMPEMDGQDALARIRESEKDILSSEGVKIVMITALDNIKNVSQAYSNLCDGYIAKPLSRDELLGTLHKLSLICEPAKSN